MLKQISSALRSHPRGLLVGGVFSIVAVTLMLIGSVGSLPARERAKAWIAAHSGSLPATLEDFAAYPEAYRNEIFAALSPDAKSHLWRSHLGSVLAHEKGLSSEQHDFIVDVIALATPESYAPGVKPPDICGRVAELFPEARQRKLFHLTRLGSTVTPHLSLDAVLVNVAETVRNTFTAQASSTSCDCRGEGWCECEFDEECITLSGCDPAQTCGCTWPGECDERICIFQGER